ncbi:hypothetical protein [Haloferula sp. BvORR071]|uniref:hypothetical protein n=1 Tax=Haloferula sp. BvORR071 TaxID=1396141 RepID=UPI0005554973|nr:hypothetical protein [Haloferula sp. BvORR071]
MKRALLIALAAGMIPVASAQLIEPGPKRRPHTQDSTGGYEASPEEKKFEAKKPITTESGFGSTKADSLLGVKGKLVSWFGIVRELPGKDGGTYLIEHKYFDGLNDDHIQLASLYGAGDFHVEAKDPRGEIKRLALVRVIGTVTEEKDKVPTVKADYIRVWKMGDYTFMDYGVDASNEKWKKLRKEMELIYDPDPDAAYYEKLLGK